MSPPKLRSEILKQTSEPSPRADCRRELETESSEGVESVYRVENAADATFRSSCYFQFTVLSPLKKGERRVEFACSPGSPEKTFIYTIQLRDVLHHVLIKSPWYFLYIHTLSVCLSSPPSLSLSLPRRLGCLFLRAPLPPSSFTPLRRLSHPVVRTGSIDVSIPVGWCSLAFATVSACSKNAGVVCPAVLRPSTRPSSSTTLSRAPSDAFSSRRRRRRRPLLSPSSSSSQNQWVECSVGRARENPR